MQTTVTFNQAINVINQLSLADQWRLLSWLMDKFKQMFKPTVQPERGSAKAILNHAGSFEFVQGELDQILTDITTMRELELVDEPLLA